jgi:DNA-binding Lrp family transcriptional regulator
LLRNGVIQKIIVANNTKSFQTIGHMRHHAYPTPSELKILRCLVLNPHIGVADIAQQVAVSARTANRIINQLRDKGVARFSVICDPAAMKGLVVFGLLIYVNDSKVSKKVESEQKKKDKKAGPHKILERLYTEFPEYPFLRSPLISHDNIIITSVYGNDVFAIDSMFRKILSFEEVEKAELYIFTSIRYHKESIVNEIDLELESESEIGILRYDI